MLTSIRLRNFKSFADAEAPLGPLTLLVGANASGKSNLLDALRFLKGVASTQLPVDRLLQGQASGRGGAWPGIRGGIHEVVRNGAGSFTIEATWRSAEGDALTYTVECAVEPRPWVREESLNRAEMGASRASNWRFFGNGDTKPALRVSSAEGEVQYDSLALSQRSVLQMARGLEASGSSVPVRDFNELADGLSALTFLDITPPLMRQYVPKEMTELGESGENLSAVLFRLCQDPEQKQGLVDWLAELCAPELADIDFSVTDEGEVMVRLLEKDGIRVSARSLSDGTLRFLGELVALRTAPPGSVILMEEIGNGLHPRRMHLLVEYLEAITEERGIQVIATTHSPLVLQALGPKARADAVVLGRAQGHPGTILRRAAELEGFDAIVERRGMDYLFTTGWLEQAL